MRIIPFSSLLWDANAALLPNSKRRYNTRHLALVKDDESPESGLYILVFNRNQEEICKLQVEADDAYRFSKFQNVLLTSKL
ncbi:hypothetical protein [Alicyclobacillus dauci]|uniref:Uncharacterized protein n=1 Tax=Alicyclobacillus dauci TaxID=1475485 RepID=A0ABY6Z4H5_9BACL|nr:hypothetical protein [Alicyclobacillus dauci]WAH37221.1 hypothetical protein NZD86_01340 [Alicyclobacillus dauci]